MLYALAALLALLWFLALLTSYTLGGYIHMLLVLAVIALLAGLIRSERAQ